MGQKNATTTATQQLPGYLNSAYQGIIGSAQQTASQPYQAYTGGFTPDQQAAFQSIRGLGGPGNAAFNSASAGLGASMTPTYASVGNYMSPYTQQVIQSMMGNMQEQNAQQQQQVLGNAAAKGALGGNRVGVAQAELARQQKLADNQAIAGLYNQNYAQGLGAAQADKTAMMQAAGQYTGLGGAQMGAAQAALGAGTQQQQFDYQQYLNQLAFPYQQQSWLAGIAGGLGSTAGGTTTQQTPQGNTLSQLMGVGLTAASLFSDKRMKEGVRQVGKTFDDQPIYSYRYKGSPQTHMGLIAQEVRKDHPDAVGVAGGMMTVDYDKATKDAAGRGHFYAGGVARPGYAMGGMPYGSPDGAAFGSYMTQAGGMPYSGGGGIDFGSYIPAPVQIGGGGGGNFPEIQQFEQPEDPLMGGNPTDAMKKGFTNIQGWMSPAAPALAAKVKANGGVVSPRHGYQAGGSPSLDLDYINALVSGQPGQPLSMVTPTAADTISEPPKPPVVDATDIVLDSRALGLGAGMGSPGSVESFPPAAGGGDDVPYQGMPGLIRAKPNMPGAMPFAKVPYNRGEAFRTDQPGGYSGNIQEAFGSLMSGRGLNLSPDANHGLMAAGLGMMASRSPFALQGIGEGGLTGLKAYNERQALERENALARAGIGQRGQEIANSAEVQAANIGLTDATAGHTDVQSYNARYAFTGTPVGIRVTDAVNPSSPFVVPWGGVLPDGQRADPSMVGGAGGAAPGAGGAPSAESVFVTEAPTGPVDQMLMSPEFVPQVAARTHEALTGAYGEMTAAQSTNQLLQEMKHSLASLPDGGLMAPGTDFAQRAELAKGVNTYLNIFGLPGYFPTAEIAASEDLNKVTTRLGFDLSRMLGSNEAASVVMSGISAVPGGANSKEGAELIIGALEAANLRRIHRHKFLESWAQRNHGSTAGADQWFNATNPPELYAISAYVPLEDIELLRKNPSEAAAFNEFWGKGQNIAQFVLRGQ